MSIGGYRNVINNSNKVLLTELYIEVFAQAVDYYCLYHIDHRKGLNKQMEGNMIIRLNRTMERKICLNTYFKGISFPRTSRARYP